MAYHAMAIIVLLNMLIAMMSNSFQEIEVTSAGDISKSVQLKLPICQSKFANARKFILKIPVHVV